MTTTCKLGEKGCWNDGKCRATSNCVNKIVTNADRIRAMSDEELAKLFFDYIPIDVKCSFCKPTMRTDNKCNGRCRSGILEWLKQTAEGGGNE